MSDTINSFMANGGGGDPSGGGSGSTADPTAMLSHDGGHDLGADGSDPASQSGMYDQLKAGGSAIAVISKFGLAMSKASAISDAADQSKLAAKQEYLQAQAQAGEIQRALLSTIGSQQAVAAGGGVDIASGSVQEAGRQAGLTAGRAERSIRSTADMNAAMRMARFYALKQAASVQRVTGFLNAGADVANMVFGGPGGGGGGMPVGE